MAKMSEKILQKKISGAEPIAATVDKSNSLILIDALNWYARNFETSDVSKVANSIDLKLTDMDVERIRTPLIIKHMISRGWKLPSDIINRSDNKIKELLEKNKKIEESKESVVRKSPYNKNLDFAYSFIDSEIDIHFNNNDYMPSVYQFLMNNSIPVQVVNYLLDKYKLVLEEVSDRELVNLPNDIRRKRIKMYTTIVNDLKHFIAGKKQVRKKPVTKKKKIVPIEKKIKNFKYQEKDDQLKLVSILPEHIIGAKSLWVFNTKYRRICVFNSKDERGLDIKGASIISFDEETSITKSVRNPEVILRMLMETGKVALRKFMDDINTKPYTPNGRITEHTLILKAIK